MATIDFVVKNGLVVTEEAQVLSTTDAASSSDTAAAIYTAGGLAVAKKAFVGTTLGVGTDLTVSGDVAINGGDLTTTTTTFNLLNATATTVNFAGAGTAVNIGAATGTTNVKNNLDVDGDVNIDGGDLTASGATFNLVNTTITTGNLFGAATSINVGAATGTYTLNNPTLTMANGVAFNMNGANPAIASSNTGTASIFNANIATINFGQAADISMGGTAKTVTVRGALSVNGNTTLGDANTDTVTFTADTANVNNTLTFTTDDAVANNITYPVKIRHTTSGTAANGIGAGLQFIVENAAGVNKVGVQLDAIATSVTNGAENFSFIIDTMTAGGTPAQALLVNNNTVTVGASSTATTINTQTSSALTVTTGAAGVTSAGNAVTVTGGLGGATSGAGGAATFKGGDASTSGAGGIATLRSGAAVGTNITGADTVIEAGNGTGTGGSGKISFRTAAAGASGATANTMVERFAISNTGNFDINGDLTISGNFTVNGLTTTVNSTTLTVDDKNIELGAVVAKSSLQATLATGTAVVTLTSGDTKGLIPGMALSVNSGTGAFGASAVIATVDSLTQFTASVNHATAGAVTFTAGGVTDFTADGGGITVKGATDKTFTWVRSTGNWTANANLSAPAFVSTATTGTAPFAVASTTSVSNLNADLLDGQHGSWYQDWTNITNKPDPVITVTLTGDVTGTANTTLTDLASGTVSVATTIAANSVALGTDTTGNYMIDVTAGTGISISHTQGEGSTATITNAGVTGLTAGGAITVSAATGSVTVSHTDTSAVADVTAATNQFITAITFDTYGHVQSVTRAAPSGFLTAESDTLATVSARGNTYTGNIETTVRPRVGVTTYRDHSTTAFNDAAIRSRTNTEDVWIYCDEANAQWGIYHRNIDSSLAVSGEQTIPGNSLAFIGANSVASYICLADGSAYFRGSIQAATKSFLIDHPTKEGMKLRYGSLEGPENGVYVRGKLVDNNVIELPDYWTGLVHADSITVNLTAAGPKQQLYVEKIENNCVYVVNETGTPINCFYTVYGERKDVDKLEIEVTANE